MNILLVDHFKYCHLKIITKNNLSTGSKCAEACWWAIFTLQHASIEDILASMESRRLNSVVNPCEGDSFPDKVIFSVSTNGELQHAQAF